MNSNSIIKINTIQLYYIASNS